MLKSLSIALTILLAVSCSRPFVVVQIADVQMGFAAAALAGKSGEELCDDWSFESDCLRRAVSLINDIRPDAVVFTGDQVNVAGCAAQWDAFGEIAGQISSGVRVFYLPGNHDVAVKDGLMYSDEYTVRCGADRFCYRGKGVRLVGMNTNLVQHGLPQEEEQLAWLKNILENKHGKDDVTLVFGHHPFFLNDIDEPDSYFPIGQSKRHVYFDLFAANGVDAVYAGHRHATFDADYSGIPMKTTTSAAFQIGKSKPSVRVIVVDKGRVSDELREL